MMPNEDPPRPPANPMHGFGNYSLHPLATLDGVLIYVALNGETVGYFFGRTAEAAAEAVAAKLRERVATDRP
jgi:hypothetical protein